MADTPSCQPDILEPSRVRAAFVQSVRLSVIRPPRRPLPPLAATDPSQTTTSSNHTETTDTDAID